MDTDPGKKTCKMCRMEIPKDARKCPFCHHFQNRLVLFMYHPAFAMLMACIPIAAMLIVFSSIFDRGENYETYKSQIEVTDSQLEFGDVKSGPTVVVIGTIKNTSQVAWKEVVLHADFFDANGKRTDVGEREEYSFYLPAHGSSSFKVSFQREFPESDYAKYQIRVVTAKDARALW